MMRRVLLALLAVLLASAPVRSADVPRPTPSSGAPAASATTAPASAAPASAATTAARESAKPAGILAEGTRWATPYYVIDSGKPGPTVMVTAGIHGDEPAGATAAGQIRHWPIARGKLVVLPRANVPGLEASQRRLPDVEDSDLNRNFPQADDAKPLGQPAGAIWDLVRRIRPDWLIDMHESENFRKKDPKKVGCTIIPAVADRVRPQAQAMIEAVNATISDEERQFILLKSAVKGSLVRSAGDRLGVRAMIVETARPDQALVLRTRQHRVVVHRLLSELGMAACDADTLLPPRRDGGLIRVAIYAGTGAGPGAQITAAISGGKEDADGIVTLGEAEVRSDVLRQFDVVVFPGGSASKQAGAIGEAGREAVRDFVRRGGGYFGVCAGAYLATSHYSWSLGVLDSASLDTKHWKRGTGKVEVELTEAGRQLFGHTDATLSIYFANGPLLGPDGKADIPDFETLAVYRGDMAKGVPGGAMPGTVAMARGRFGEGRVIVFSPHPEKTAGIEAFSRRAVEWAADK